MIVAYDLTDKDTGDSDQVGDILDQVDGVFGRLMADGAYDGEPVYEAVKRYSHNPPT